MGIKEKEICEPWEDVFDVSLDEHLAPELGDLLSGQSEQISIYTDPYEFFSRTYVTDSMLESLENIINVLKGKGGNNTFTIYSLFGGGKTHSLFTIYHAVKKPEVLTHKDVLKGYDEVKKRRIMQITSDIETLKGAQVVIVYGKDYRYCGRPSVPIDLGEYKIHTVWGYLAHCLGRYDDMRRDDEGLTVPDVPTLRKVLGDKPNIILIDEIVDYAYGLKASRTKEENEYVDSIPQFLDRLVSAVVGTKTAVVVTLPIEARGEGIEKTETWYDTDFIRKYWTALHRTGARDLPALKIETNEVVDVIKKRNFKRIDEEKAEAIIKDFERIYRQNKNEVFGSYEDTIKNMKVSYPYHPDLVNILTDIIEKAGLQRTRDMLKITRKIIRQIWKSGDDPCAIMPWYLDVTSDSFHGDLFRSGIFADYSSVIMSDIKGDAEKFNMPMLARKIAIVIFLKTYIYDSPTPQPYFPSAFDIAKMVYEQDFFVMNRLMPTAIIDTIEQMENKEYMHHLQSKDGRYWFWKIASVKEQIESEAKKLMDEDKDSVEEKMAEMVEKLIKGDTPTKGKKKKIQGIKVLNEKATYTTRRIDEYVEDTPIYKTIFLVNGDATLEDCERIMFKFKNSDRRYKNTVICVYPYSNEDYKKCMQHASLVLACEKTEKDLPQLYPGADENVLKVQKSIIDRLYSSAEDGLERELFGTFKKVVYPSTERDKTRPKAAWIEAPEGAEPTLLGQTFLALSSPQLAKILDSLSFDLLRREINDIMEIDIENNASKKIGEIKDWFKTNPAFPMVEDKDIEKAIKEGVEKLSIGVSNGEIWYKKVYEKEVYEKDVDFDHDAGNVPESLKDDYKILPWKEAINLQMDKLLEEIKNAGENIKDVIIEYKVKYEGSDYPLEKLIKQTEWEEIIRQGFIIKKKEVVEHPKKEFSIKITPEEITAKPGDEKEVKIIIEPVEEIEKIFVKIQPDLGKVTPQEGVLPLECTWKLSMPSEKGMRGVEIKVESDEKRKVEILVLHIESDVIFTRDILKEHIGMVLFEVSGIKDVDLLKELNTLSEKVGKKTAVFGNVKISRENKGINIALKDITGDIAEYMISQTEELMNGETSMDLTCYLDTIKIDELAFHKISPYNGKAELFKLKKSE